MFVEILLIFLLFSIVGFCAYIHFLLLDLKKRFILGEKMLAPAKSYAIRHYWKSIKWRTRMGDNTALASRLAKIWNNELVTDEDMSKELKNY